MKHFFEKFDKETRKWQPMVGAIAGEFLRTLTELRNDLDILGPGWRLNQELEIADPETIANRLRGIYHIPVNDGAGLLNGKDTFTREFPNQPPIQIAAAALIEQLQEEIARLKSENKKLSNRIAEQGWQNDYDRTMAESDKGKYL